MSKEDAIQKLATLSEISEIYSIPLSTLRRWASERRFFLYKISNRIRVDKKEFNRWIESFRVSPHEKRGEAHERQR